MGLRWRGTQKIGFLRINMTHKGLSSISERYGPFTRNSRTNGWRLDLPLGFHHVFEATGNMVLDRIRGAGIAFLALVGSAITLAFASIGLMIWTGALPSSVLLIPVLIPVLMLATRKRKPRRRRRR